MNIENVPVCALKPYTGNARKHSKKQVKQIARSIERFGFCNPVLVDDNLQIIAGHGRVAQKQRASMDSHKVISVGTHRFSVPHRTSRHIAETDCVAGHTRFEL
jgi:ParB-like chromosome segregation protein Spo0J